MDMRPEARAACPINQPLELALLELQTLHSNTDKGRTPHNVSQEEDGSRIKERSRVSSDLDAWSLSVS